MNQQAKKQHAEAFCLMEYKCQGCARRELIWNSRDGVSPFGTGCPDPECEGNMNHVNWSLDRPFDSLPADADRVIVDLTEEDALKIAEKRILHFYEEPSRPPQISVKDLAANIYRDGRQPRIVSVEEYKRRAGIEEADPGDFAKFWRFDYFGQVVVAIVGPSVKIFYQPGVPGISPVELDLLALSCGDGVAPVRARQVFEDMTRERVLEILNKAEAAILNETTSHATKH